MNATRIVMWLVGLVAILAGAYMLYFEADLDRWVSLGVLGAGLLLFIGLAIMAFAGSSRGDDDASRAAGGDARVIVEQEPRRTAVRDDTRFR